MTPADAGRRVYRHFFVLDQAEDAVEVIRMSVRHQDRQQWLLGAEPGTQRLDVGGDQQVGVNSRRA